MRTPRPRVIANFALTADGKISTRRHTPADFTSPADKQRLREIRALGDAVLAGAGTVATDTMTMGLKDPRLQAARLRRGLSAQPLRVIVSTGRSLDPRWKVFRYTSSPLVVFSTTALDERLRPALARRCDLWLFEGKSVDLSAMLAILRSSYSVRTLVCEGGPTLFRSLVEINAVDELRLTWAPLVFGGKNAPTLTGLPGAFLPRLVRCSLKKMETLGSECFLTYRLTAPARRSLPGSSPAPRAAR